MSSPYFERCTTTQLRLNSIPNAPVFQGNLSQGVSYGAQPSARILDSVEKEKEASGNVQGLP